MPCWTVQTAEVDLGKVDENLLRSALQEMGIRSYTYEKSTGILTTREQVDLAKVKQAYSRQVVLTQAKRFGWQMKEVAPMRFEVVKR